MSGKRYWAFLSYSHQDRVVAGWLHRALETYDVPARLVGRPTAMGPAPRRLRPIFRDREDLTAAPSLRERVHEALDESAYLIVVCSPAAVKSKWVNAEVTRFKAKHGEDRVLAVVVAGTPHASEMPGREDEECFPSALRVRVDEAGALTEERAEPVAADLRPTGDGRRLARLKLLAPMLGVDLDDLAHRDANRRAAQMASFSAALGVVALATTGLAIEAIHQRNEARHQRAEAEGLVEFMLGDLKKKLTPEGRLDILDAVGTEALKYYSDQSGHGMGPDDLGRRARVLHMLGEIQDKRGDLTKALKLFQQASITTAELLRRDPNNGARVFEHAQSVFWVGEIAERRGNWALAEDRFREYKRLAERLTEIDPRNDAWRSEVEDANLALGTVLLPTHRIGEALAAFRRALAISQSLAAASPADPDRRTDVAVMLPWVADAELASGAPDLALKDRMAERALCEGLLKDDPNDHDMARGLVVNHSKVARLYLGAGRVADAIAEAEQAVRDGESLAATDPENMEYRQNAADALNVLAKARLQARDLEAARAADGRALKAAEALTRADSTVARWKGPLLGEARVLSFAIDAAASKGDAGCRAALAPAAAEAARLEALSRGQARDDGLARLTAEAEMMAGDYAARTGDLAAAKAAWTRALSVVASLGDGSPGGLDPQALGLAEAATASLKTGASGGGVKSCDRLIF